MVENWTVAPNDEFVLKSLDLVDLIGLIQSINLNSCDVYEVIVGVSEVELDFSVVRSHSIRPNYGLILETDELISPVD